MLRPVGVPEVPVETAALARKVHPRGTDEMRVRDALGPLFADEDFTSEGFADMYASLGQPGLSPALLAMVTVLQFLHHLSDRDAAQAVADRISWKYMLGLELEDTGFDYTVLSLGRGGAQQTAPTRGGLWPQVSLLLVGGKPKPICDEAVGGRGLSPSSPEARAPNLAGTGRHRRRNW